MKTKTKVYETPQIEVCQMLLEGAVLSASSFPGDNESYGGDPFFDGDYNNPIF